jgi:hypothetical protein
MGFSTGFGRIMSSCTTLVRPCKGAPMPLLMNALIRTSLATGTKLASRASEVLRAP